MIILVILLWNEVWSKRSNGPRVLSLIRSITSTCTRRCASMHSHNLHIFQQVIWPILEVLIGLIGYHRVTQSAVAKTMSSSQSHPLNKSFLFVCFMEFLGGGQKGRDLIENEWEKLDFHCGHECHEYRLFLIWHIRCNISWIFEICLLYPSGKERKCEGDLGRWLGELSVYQSHHNQVDQSDLFN